MKLRSLSMCHTKFNLAFLVGILLVLFFLGGLNLLFAHHKLDRNKMDAIILDTPSKNPMFYLNQFIFPNTVPIPVTSNHTGIFIEPLLPFASSIKKIKASREVNNNDSFIIEYKGSESQDVNRCDGTPLMPSETTESLYFISKGDLHCTEIINNQINYNDSHAIAKNVEAMRVLYGMDLNHDSVTDLYTTANGIHFNPANLSSIKISLLIKTYKKDGASSISKIYPLGESKVGPYADAYIRKTLTLVIPIKQQDLHSAN